MPLNVWTPPKPRRSYLYLPDGWDTAWVAAKANMGTTPVWLAAYGDSITEGVNASDFNNTGWFGLVRASLAAKYSVYGDFYSCGDSADSVSTTYNGTPTWVVNSTTGRVYQRYGCGLVPTWTGSPTNVITFTSPYACTDMDIIYHDFSPVTGSWSYQVDSGSVVTVTPAGLGYLARIQLTGLANTTHTINFSQTTALNLMPYGVATFKSRTTGLGYAKIGLYGRALSENFQLSRSAPQPDNFVVWQGKGAATTGFGFPHQPALIIIGMGINDLQSNYPLKAFEACLRRMIQALRRGYPGCSIIYKFDANPDQTSSDMTSGWFTNSDNWVQFWEVVQRVCYMFNVAILNVHAKWGATPVAQGFVTASNGHPTTAGHADIANTLLTIL